MNRFAFLVAALVLVVHGDVYLQGMRGSNNRLNEEGRERNNANRLFDSQNNNRGGYNQGNMYFYTGSDVHIEWTNQHSCGGPNNHCELVVQYMCGDLVRDGTTTNTIPDNPTKCERNDCDTDLEYGMHENYNYYKECDRRYRNKGLYTADQKMRDHARSTRQNNNAQRRGYECPEERDYYPYWHPTPWRDIVVFTDDTERCDYYKKNSQNVKNKGYCKYPDNFLEFKQAQGVVNTVMLMNTKESCESQKVEHGGEIITPKWVEVGAHDIPAPECKKAPWSRDNHHGNNVDGFPNFYTWKIPDSIIHKNCVMRLRYNITSGEMTKGRFEGGDGYEMIDHNMNAEGQNKKTGIDIWTQYGFTAETAEARGYVFKQDPTVKVFDGIDNLQLALALNTNQYSRTFEDRTHVFEIRQRPSTVPAAAKIHNLNVRGKRGNIVQTYPAVEYDFHPNNLEISVGDYIHVQWTGANSNPGNNAGQGRARTDRSNMVLLREITHDGKGKSPYQGQGCYACNYPEIITNKTDFLGLSTEDLINLAFGDKRQYFGDVEELDDTGTHFDLGLRQITKEGIYRYMCTRNNNFTNRSQKGKIIVKAK